MAGKSLLPGDLLMMAALLIPEQHRLRSKTEQFIRDVYFEEYGATLGAFPLKLLAILDEQGNILCAAGLRTWKDDFFSECYLDEPIEAVLTQATGHTVRRESVFEISTFASRAPHLIVCFIGQIIEFGEAAGFDWAFFTLTRRLQLLLDRIGLELRPLGSADIARVSEPTRWGSYYERDPRVYAGGRDSFSAFFECRHRIASNA
jgi:hypothetical protein